MVITIKSVNKNFDFGKNEMIAGAAIAIFTGVFSFWNTVWIGVAVIGLVIMLQGMGIVLNAQHNHTHLQYREVKKMLKKKK